MYVIKRDGRRESVKFDKITARIEKLSYGLESNYIQPIEVAKKVISGIYDGVTTAELDNSGGRNGGFHDHQAPRLRYSGGTHCDL